MPWTAWLALRFEVRAWQEPRMSPASLSHAFQDLPACFRGGRRSDTSVKLRQMRARAI